MSFNVINFKITLNAPIFWTSVWKFQYLAGVLDRQQIGLIALAWGKNDQSHLFFSLSETHFEILLMKFVEYADTNAQQILIQPRSTHTKRRNTGCIAIAINAWWMQAAARATLEHGFSWQGFLLWFFSTSTIILIRKFWLRILLNPPLGKSAPLEICSQAMLHIEPNSSKRRSSVMVSLWRSGGKGRGWGVFSSQRVTRNILKRKEDLFFSWHCPNTWGVRHRFAFY